MSSLIVDNQIVDVDRSRGRLLYDAVEVARSRVNGPLERFLPPRTRPAGAIGKARAAVHDEGELSEHGQGRG